MATHEHLDLAQRIAAAIARTDEAGPATGAPEGSERSINPETDVVVGEVPMHLRHLYKLLTGFSDAARERIDELSAATAEITQERIDELLREVGEISVRHNIVHAVFFEALETYHTRPEGATSVWLTSNWSIMVTKGGHEEERPGGLILGLVGGMADLEGILAMAADQHGQS